MPRATIAGEAEGELVNKTPGSWLMLILFCTASALITGLALGLVFTSVTVLSSAAQASASEAPEPAQTFVGMITDSYCGAKHKFSDRSPAECTRICVKNGSQYVLLVGNKVYALQGDIVRLNRTAGERVTVTGSLHDNTIDFTSINVGQ
jgi:hypothetical protein